MKNHRWFVIVFVVLAALAVGREGAQATPLILDYTGFSWATTNPTSQHFFAVGVVDGFSQPVNSPAEVYTYYLSNLTLASIDNPGGPQKTYHYSGGDFSIYRSTNAQNRSYDYGTNPTNPTSPSTFIDGVRWLQGVLSDFTISYNQVQQLGIMSADGSFVSGEFAPFIGPASFFNFSGLTGRPGNGIPKGYNYRMDGQTDTTLIPPVPEPASIALLGLGVATLGLGLARKRAS